MALKRREEIEAREGRDIVRMARRGAGSLLYTAMVIGAVLIVLGLSMKVNYRHDLSVRSANRLSPQTMQVLAGLEEEVKLWALYPKRLKRQREGYWNLLRRYRVESPLIEVEFVDPVARPDLVQKLGVNLEQEDMRERGLTVAVRGKRKAVFRKEVEENITNAILEVGRDERHVVGILRGYGERDPASAANNSFSAAAQAMEQEYYELRDVWLSDPIPPDVTVLVIADPRQSIPQPDLDRLAQWLEGGGRLLALLEPDDRSGLNAVLDRWGLRANGEPIFDPRSNVNRNPRILKVTDYKDHEIVRGFGKSFPTAFPTTGSVSHYEPGDPLVFHTELALSSHYSSALGRDGSKLPGPLPLAAASWKRETIDGREVLTRLVLVGDADFASRAYLPVRANRNFLLNCIGWLARQEELVSIRRQPLAGQTFDIKPEDRPALYAAILGAPALVIVAGLVVLFRRRGL